MNNPTEDLRATSREKQLGQFFTPEAVARSLVSWVGGQRGGRTLDPSCGDGAFLKHLANGVGIECCPEALRAARGNAPEATIVESDFFAWAAHCRERFDAVVGNPPFIRYQQFAGHQREGALSLARQVGADFTGLSSSWAPFLAVAASLLQPGGRMAFVVPAEIGHATYAPPLIEYLANRFGVVVLVAIRNKLFPGLSEDAWLLYADEFGSRTSRIGLAIADDFSPSRAPPRPDRWVSVGAWKAGGARLRRFLLPERILSHYDELLAARGVRRLHELAEVGIGYVTGDNDFFHLSPSELSRWGISRRHTRVAVRSGEQLGAANVTLAAVRRWLAEDRSVLLLNLRGVDVLPRPLRDYLDSERGRVARTRYKCRVRTPWFAVPNVRSPDAFLTYMNGRESRFVLNRTSCVCTNTLHTVFLKAGASAAQLKRAWESPLSRLSQELEGHPLGGGMLKFEPGEAARIAVPLREPRTADADLLAEGIHVLRAWRHYG